ncbi:Brix-domain-containing protein [Rhizodiscina lignyota]|uniref:Ribosome production factor 2 homolog n=1 Tax=Rhizodiscina lignyota TaxID=1504668 RepID=A0A9P4M6B5_9PEZI|nr:Brix-domain-containing protein [Rhizodiscina lignyota]
MLRQITPRNARSKRALEKREPQVNENPRKTLFVRGEKCSQILQLAIADLCTIKKPLATKFNKKNQIRPFEDASSLEFFSDKNDASLLVFGQHSKKRPHSLTLVRTFNYKVLDMLELYLDPDSFRTMSQFKNSKVGVGLKPMICFSGTIFESPTPNAYTMAKSLLLDLLKGQDVQSVDVEGLQFMIHISAGEEVEGQPAPKIHIRFHKIKTKKSGQRLPRVEVEEIGPRLDFRVGRMKEAEAAVMKEALKKPRQLEPKTKKNIETDAMGDKVGRIHVGKQNIGNLQTRKMKGLKRSRDEMIDEEMTLIDDESDDGNQSKRAR